MSRMRRSGAPGRRHSAGMSLIELMISLVLGLLVVGAAIGIFITNRRTYAATENLGRVQENVRTAFELMTRDIREAGGNQCNSSDNMGMSNVINNPASRWWTNWSGNRLVGVSASGSFPDTVSNRVANTEGLMLMSSGDATAIVTAHTPAAAQFTVNTNTHGLRNGDLLIACGPNSQATGVLRTGALFQMSSGAGTTTIGHAVGGSPGNSSSNLGINGSVFTYGPNTMLSRLNASRWFIGTNSSGGRSLYQGVLTNTAGTPAILNQEVAENVQNMVITYLVPSEGGYVSATTVGTRWDQVTAINLSLTFQTQDAIGTNGLPLTRTISNVVTLRNRNQ